MKNLVIHYYNKGQIIKVISKGNLFTVCSTIKIPFPIRQEIKRNYNVIMEQENIMEFLLPTNTMIKISFSLN